MNVQTINLNGRFTVDTLKLDRGATFIVDGWHGTDHWMVRGEFVDGLVNSDGVRWLCANGLDAVRLVISTVAHGFPIRPVRISEEREFLQPDGVAAPVIGEGFYVNATYVDYVEAVANVEGEWHLMEMVLPGRVALQKVLAYRAGGHLHGVLAVWLPKAEGWRDAA